jgi:hypothetical protein
MKGYGLRRMEVALLYAESGDELQKDDGSVWFVGMHASGSPKYVYSASACGCADSLTFCSICKQRRRDDPFNFTTNLDVAIITPCSKTSIVNKIISLNT